MGIIQIMVIDRGMGNVVVIRIIQIMVGILVDQMAIYQQRQIKLKGIVILGIILKRNLISLQLVVIVEELKHFQRVYFGLGQLELILIELRLELIKVRLLLLVA